MSVSLMRQEETNHLIVDVGTSVICSVLWNISSVSLRLHLTIWLTNIVSALSLCLLNIVTESDTEW